MNAEEQYQAELIKVKESHHTPTAGAMTSHVLANLMIHATKLFQAYYSIKGSSINGKLKELAQKEQAMAERLNELLLAEGEVIPTTTEKFKQYTMLEESGEFKYLPTADILTAQVADFNTELLFITRAIKLAEKADYFGLSEYLKEVYTNIKEAILYLQTYLGHEVTFGLEEDE